MNIHKVPVCILFDTLPCPPSFSPSVGNIILNVILHLSFFFRSQESETDGRAGRSPQSNVTAQCQKHHNGGSVCAKEQMGAHTQNIPPLLGRQPLAQCSLSLSRRVLCFHQQEPAAETCYCAVSGPEHNEQLAKRAVGYTTVVVLGGDANSISIKEG